MTLSRLRVRLTLWYAATFTLILVLLGAGLFLAIGTQVSRRIGLSLAGATAAIVRATHDLENERAASGAADAVEELHIPDRELYLFDTNGRALTPPQADLWIVDAARAAATSGSVDAQHVTGGSHERRLHAERFTGRSGTPYVAVAVAELPDIREQYASLIGPSARPRWRRSCWWPWAASCWRASPRFRSSSRWADASLHGRCRARAAHARYDSAHPDGAHAGSAARCRR